MSERQPEQGSSLTSTFKVQSGDLASVVSPDAVDVYPQVFATSRLVAFMEIVSARILVPYLAPGQLSVGVRVDVTHSAATPVNEDVSVTAKFLGKEGKVFAFEVVARDRGGEIGVAKHTRAVIDQERLMNGTKKRMAVESKV